MPIYRTDLVVLTRRIGKLIPTLMGKRERITHPYDNEPEMSRNEGIKLGITERVELLEVQQQIEKILEKCKDDGYHCS